MGSGWQGRELGVENMTSKETRLRLGLKKKEKRLQHICKFIALPVANFKRWVRSS